MSKMHAFHSREKSETSRKFTLSTPEGESTEEFLLVLGYYSSKFVKARAEFRERVVENASSATPEKGFSEAHKAELVADAVEGCRLTSRSPRPRWWLSSRSALISWTTWTCSYMTANLFSVERRKRTFRIRQEILLARLCAKRYFHNKTRALCTDRENNRAFAERCGSS